MMKKIMSAIALCLVVLSNIWALDGYALEYEEAVINRPRPSVYVEKTPSAEWYEVTPDLEPCRYRLVRLKSGSWDWYELLESGHYVDENSDREYEKRITLSLEQGDNLLANKETAIGFSTDPEWLE